MLMTWHGNAFCIAGLNAVNTPVNGRQDSQSQIARSMMMSSNGNIFRVTGHLCGEFTGPGEFPAQRPVTRSFDVSFDLHPNKRLSKQWWGWWLETPSCPLWRHRNARWHMAKAPPPGQVNMNSVVWLPIDQHELWRHCEGIVAKTLKQNVCHFADDTFNYIFLNGNVRFSIKISLRLVPKSPFNNIPALVQLMAWRLPGDRPLSEPMIIRLLTHICVTGPQWVK